MPIVLDCHTEPGKSLSGSKNPIIITSQEEIRSDYTAYLQDESRLTNGQADTITFPEDESQVADALHNACQNQQAVTFSGGRTGVVGGAVPGGGAVISTEKMESVLHTEIRDALSTITVQPGMTLTRLSEFLNQHHPEWFYPPDPTEKSASIGGTVATNASGARSFKYGQTRNHIHRLRVALTDGTVLDIKRGLYILEQNTMYAIEGLERNYLFSIPNIQTPAIKNTAGYYIHPRMDLIDLFIGSEGTLGAITEIELKLKRKSPANFAAIAFFPSEPCAFDFVREVKKSSRKHSRISPTAIEYFDNLSLELLRQRKISEGAQSEIPKVPEYAEAAVFFEQACLEEDLEDLFLDYDTLLQNDKTNMDQTWGGFTHEEIEKLNLFRHALPETVNMLIGQRQKKLPGLHKISTDFVVPEDRMPLAIQIYQNRLKASGLDYVIFGHIGENHLHINMLPKNEEELNLARTLYFDLAGEVIHMNGTVSGEHGIGRLKKHLFLKMYPPRIIDQFHQIKLSFDPEENLEKGVLF